MVSLDSNRVRNFLDYMLFFEYAKHLKDSNVIKRGLLSPDIEDEPNIRKRISSVLLKGLRCDLGFDIGLAALNGKEHASCDKITRVRSRSNHTTENYFSFTNIYNGKKFIAGEEFDVRQVSTITGAAHKEGLIRALAYGGEEEKIQNIIDNYEIVFFKTPSWWNITNNITGNINNIPNRLDTIISTDNNGLEEVRNHHLSIRNVSIDLLQANSGNRYGMYYFKDVAGDTVKALYQKYCLGDNVRIPGPNFDANPTYTTSPVLSNSHLDKMISENRNHILFSLGNILQNHGDYSLSLCKKFTDSEGTYLAPNLFDVTASIQWKATKELLSRPELFFKYIKEFDSMIKNVLIGRNNE